MEEGIRDIESNEVYKIYPILKSGDWIKENIDAGLIRQTLVGTPENPELVIAFGYDTPNSFVFLTQKDLSKIEPNEILRQGYENLEAYETEFERSANFDGRILLSSGKDFSSERILSKSHMTKAHSMLGAEELLVSIPRRRCMMVTARNADKELLNAFAYLHNDAWKDDTYGNTPIINAVFVVIKGSINGIISMDSSGS